MDVRGFQQIPHVLFYHIDHAEFQIRFQDQLQQLNLLDREILPVAGQQFPVL